MTSRAKQALAGLLLTAAVLALWQRPAHAIVNGTPATPGEFPWQAQISVAGDLLCGGTLIATRWVLTAGHCVAEFVESDLTVTLGQHSLSQSDGTEQTRSVSQIVRHDHFDGDVLHNDVALLRLSFQVFPNAYVQPIEVASGDYPNGTVAALSGWGFTQPPVDLPDTLVKASLPLASTLACSPEMSTQNPLLASMLCAGTGVVSDPRACHGDSGGGLVVINADGEPELVGVDSWTTFDCASGYTVFSRARDFKHWVETQISSRPAICTGHTAPGYTEWYQAEPNLIYTDVDTSACDWSGTPLYFTSLGGTGSHYNADGATAIVGATPTRFRIFVSKGGITPAVAQNRRFHINWQATPNDTIAFGMCAGKSPSNTWQQYQSDSLYIDVDTTSCGMFITPSYLTSLGGLAGHSRLIGGSAIYSPTPWGFRVYVRYPGTPLTPELAEAFDWHIMWRAQSVSLDLDDVCNGRTTPGSTNWVQDGSNRIYTDVNTSACNIETIPKVFTALGGSTSHWSTRHVTSIYQPTPNGFRIYLTQGGLTPTVANQRSYHVLWNIVP